MTIQFYHQPSFTATLATLPQTAVNRQWCYTRAQLYYKTYPVESIDQADPATPRDIGILAKCLFNITPPIYLHTWNNSILDDIILNKHQVNLLWSKHICIIYKEMNILHSGGKHFTVQLWYLDSVLQIKEKIVEYRNGFLEKSCKNIQIIKRKKY
jgi:hypothetical protein